jgi:hypothetical protein
MEAGGGLLCPVLRPTLVWRGFGANNFSGGGPLSEQKLDTARLEHVGEL